MINIKNIGDFSNFTTEQELGFINESINNTYSTVALPVSKFSHFATLGFFQIEVNDTPFQEMVDDGLIQDYCFEDVVCFEKNEGDYTTRLFLTQWDFTHWEGKDITYLIAGKVYYKYGEYFRKQKPAIIYHYQVPLSSSFTLVAMTYYKGEVDALVHTDSEIYRKKMYSTQSVFVSFVEYENSKRISDIIVCAFQKDYNLEEIKNIFPHIKDIKLNSQLINNFNKILGKDNIQLLEMISF